MTYVSVILPLAMPEPLTYVLPEGQTAQVGCRVRVPLGLRNTYVGVVTDVSQTRPEGDFELREVLTVLDGMPSSRSGMPSSAGGMLSSHSGMPSVSRGMLSLWQWIADYYLCPIGIVARAALPQDNRKAPLNPPLRGETPAPMGEGWGGASPSLSPAQQSALSSIREQFSTKDVVLLHGVTSSGKTEIYTKLIAETLEQGRQVLYLVPEIGLTTQLTERLRCVFGESMGVYHSRLTAAQRRDLWLRQAVGSPLPFILGVRSAVLLPWRNLGLVIIDEEHEPSYKQEEPAPRYHARSVALMLARWSGAKTLLGTATPSVESYHLAQTGRYGLVTLTERYNAVLPQVQVVDTALLRHRKQMKGLLSPQLLDSMRTAMERGEQTVLFASRRGYAAQVECKDCGWTSRCMHCDVTLTLHRREKALVCHYCGRVYPVPQECPACHCKTLRQCGMGTEKVEEAVLEAFPEARVERMDLDTTRDADAMHDIIGRMESRQTDVLVGTQMITKGLDFEGVTVVGVVSADGVLSQPDFRAYERGYSLLSQVAGRAGRRDNQGTVLIQTRQADLPMLGHVVQQDYMAMYRETLAEREAFVFPPFCRIINIYIRHRSEGLTERVAQELARALQSPAMPHVELLGPAAPLHSRVSGLSVRTIMLKLLPGHDGAALRRRLRQLQQTETRAQVYFDVDPQ